MSQDYLKITLSEDSKAVIISRVVMEGGEEKELFMQPIPREQFRVEIVENSKMIVWSIATGNVKSLIGGEEKQESSLESLNFSPHQTLEEKKNALMMLPIFASSAIGGGDGIGGGGSGSGGSGFVDVRTDGTEYETGRRIDGATEYARIYQYEHPSRYDMDAGGSLEVRNITADVQEADQNSVSVDLMYYKDNFAGTFDTKFSASYGKGAKSVVFRNFHSQTFALVQGRVYWYKVTYTKQSPQA